MTTDSGFVLAADIGGTNARFALFTTGGGVRMAAGTQLPTASFASFHGLVEAAARELAEATGWSGESGAPDSVHFPGTTAAALAVAGPVERGLFCQPPNIDYVMDLEALPVGLLPGASILLNDFAAQAHGCRLFGEQRSLSVLPGRMDPARTQAVVGPGTGLGKAALVPVSCAGGGEYVVCGSEGGHAAFPFNGPEERRFQEFVQAEVAEPFARWETVVSGSGLALLHRYHTGQSVASPAEAAAALGPGSPVAEWFARFLGRACRDYVLDVLATGGLFISGGVAARNPMLLEHPAFAREFRTSPAHAGLLSAVPVRLVADQQVGLWGAASRALALVGERQGA
ncbi:glucokinase [Fundidesulfovibrio putealis]|uniref:glucokinase n=1 Tax=Fundidesulfovibrio putealis TaxID=270496 RepID=UPI000425B904|nr:glucokinase [Fundidesulfovibrio putealis]